MDSAQQEGLSSWQSLPYEIQLKILRKVPLSKQKLRSHLASKAWTTLLDDPASYGSDLDWEQGYLVLAGAQAQAARKWLSGVSSLRIISPQQQLQHSYILYASDRSDRLSLRDLPRSLTRLALSQYNQPDFELLPSSVTELVLRDCTLTADAQEYWGRIRRLDLQLHMPQSFFFGSLKPALTFLTLDCSLHGSRQGWQMLSPMKAQLMPNLERLDIINVGMPKGDFAMYLWSFFDELPACPKLQLVNVSMYEHDEVRTPRRAKFFKKIGQVLPPDCTLLVHELSDD